MPRDFTLGADPELIFVGPGGIVSANNWFERQNNHGGHNPEIGADGHPHTAEVRPPPSNTPSGLVANLEDIFRRNYKMIPEDISWQGGSYVFNKAIGGHIHFGGVSPSDEILAVLDGIVSQVVILLEDKEGARKRRSSTYGQLKDIRRKNWGFEYRPLPSWIVSKEIALGVIALATAVVYEETSNGPNKIRNLAGSILTKITRINNRNFRNCHKPYFEEKLGDLFDHIRKLQYWRTKEGRPLWKNVALLRFIANKYPDWHTEDDILKRWGIRDVTPASYSFKRTEIVPVIRDQEIIPMEEAWERMDLNED